MSTMSITLVISDIHANPWALQAVFAHAAQFGYDEIWFLGDLWGYGPDPHQVWKMLFAESHRCPVVALAGNHDWAVCGLPAGAIRSEARAVIDDHRHLLRSSVIEQMKRLPVMCSPRHEVYLAHGEVAPSCVESVQLYVHHPLHSPDWMTDAFFAAMQYDREYAEKVVMYHNGYHAPGRMFIVGQTHVQALWEWDASTDRWRSLGVNQYQWHPERPLMFNPGSVGFARDSSGCPGYAIINWQTNTLSFQRVRYNTDALKEAMRLPPYKALIEDRQFFIEPTCQESL